SRPSASARPGQTSCSTRAAPRTCWPVPFPGRWMSPPARTSSAPAAPPRDTVGSAGCSIGRHVLPDTSLLLAGVSGGLLLRRVLTALGAESGPARSALDHPRLSGGGLPGG